MAAQALWRLYPSEIAADLRREYGIRIADWHAGTLCSHELLELLEHADEDGSFKTAVREGEPSQHRKAVLQIANEVAVLRAVKAPGVDGDQWGSQFFFTPTKLRELSEAAGDRAAGRNSVFSIGAISTDDD